MSVSNYNYKNFHLTLYLIKSLWKLVHWPKLGKSMLIGNLTCLLWLLIETYNKTNNKICILLVCSLNNINVVMNQQKLMYMCTYSHIYLHLYPCVCVWLYTYAQITRKHTVSTTYNMAQFNLSANLSYF